MAEEKQNINVHRLLSSWQHRLGRPPKNKTKESICNIKTKNARRRTVTIERYLDKRTYSMVQSLKNAVYNAFGPNAQQSKNNVIQPREMKPLEENVPPIAFPPKEQFSSLPSPVLSLPKREESVSLPKEHLCKLAFQEFPFLWCIVSEKFALDL